MADIVAPPRFGKTKNKPNPELIAWQTKHFLEEFRAVLCKENIGAEPEPALDPYLSVIEHCIRGLLKEHYGETGAQELGCVLQFLLENNRFENPEHK